MKDVLSSKECAERLKALADPDRLRIVQLLRGGPRNVSEIAGELNADLANVSHHLQVLKEAKVVKSEKQGKEMHYSLNLRNIRRSIKSLDKVLDSIGRHASTGSA